MWIWVGNRQIPDKCLLPKVAKAFGKVCTVHRIGHAGLSAAWLVTDTWEALSPRVISDMREKYGWVVED